MMFWETEIFLPAVSVLAIAGAIVGCLRVRARIHQERAADIKIAHRALTQFYASVDKVITDPAAPDDLKLLLLTMAEAMPDRSAAQYIVKELTTTGFNGKRNSSDQDTSLEEWRNLHKSRPDLAEETVKAFKSGMVALILRWPETAKLFKEVLTTLTDERAEIAAVKKVSRFATEHPRRPEGEFASCIATA